MKTTKSLYQTLCADLVKLIEDGNPSFNDPVVKEAKSLLETGYPEHVYERAEAVLNDHLSIKSFPRELLRKFLDSEPEQLFAIETGYVGDTAEREYFLNRFCTVVLEIGNLPCYGDGQEAREKFAEQMVKRVSELGGDTHEIEL